MKRLSKSGAALAALLRPETDLERTLLTHPDFQAGLLWGEPRYGHPEGRVALHVEEVLDNIDRIETLEPEQRIRLRLIAFAHDTFKYLEDRSRPRDWSKHHAMLARRFMEQYVDDPVVLDIIECHDDAYYAWLACRHTSDVQQHHAALQKLTDRIGPNMQLYYLFFKCDTQTGDKTQAPLRWFESTVPAIQWVSVRESLWDLLDEPHP